MRRFYIAITSAVLLFAFTGDLAFAQCSKNWARKCITKVSPFTHNGQINTVQLREGQKTESVLTFNSGQDYRILVCSEETLENVSFVVYDMKGRIVFDSKTKNNTDVWDFKVKTTTQLKVVVDGGRNENSKGNATGCVSVLVGFKSS
jgi:hypothetical protein